MLMIPKERLFSLYTLSQIVQDHKIHHTIKIQKTGLTISLNMMWYSLKFKLVNYISVDVSLRNTMSFPSVDHHWGDSGRVDNGVDKHSSLSGL